ncbi:2OG-Fe(II) oxygenase [Thalassotalea euphylliae]|uniref:2OG-Fe(II) oxygenase n=1 Tax=Thalassotalea euphylliae TaxID=1655234 RepID=UPI00362FCE42
MAAMKKLFRWQKGRQETGYDKLLLATGRRPIPFDVYLLRFPEGSLVPAHIDKVLDGKHFRLNFVLKQAKQGGKFICNTPIYESSRVKFFRPDISEHQVTRVTSGRRYVLSIGWVK